MPHLRSPSARAWAVLIVAVVDAPIIMIPADTVCMILMAYALMITPGSVPKIFVVQANFFTGDKAGDSI